MKIKTNTAIHSRRTTQTVRKAIFENWKWDERFVEKLWVEWNLNHKNRCEICYLILGLSDKNIHHWMHSASVNWMRQVTLKSLYMGITDPE
jgi:hypothetical protein